MDDCAIIALYEQRDERAIEETDAVYGAYCRKIAMDILDSPPDAEECVNDTYLRTWNSIPPQKPSKLSAFLGRITRNLSIDRARKNRAAKRGNGVYTALLEELEPFLPCADSVEKAVEDAELTKAINDFLHTLPKRDCTLFLLRYFYGQSVRDAATKCGLSENSGKVTLHRIRRKLQSYLEQEDILL